MITPDDWDRFLVGLCGVDVDLFLLVRDPNCDIGWRPWTSDDTQTLCDWSSASQSVDTSHELKCYRVKDAAKLLGVSVPKIQQWLRRRDDPIPHVRDERVILIPAFLLRKWLTDESDRTKNGRD